MGTFIGIFQSVGSLGQALMPLAYGVLLGQIEVSGLLPVVGGLIAVSSLAYFVTIDAESSTAGRRSHSRDPRTTVRDKHESVHRR